MSARSYNVKLSKYGAIDSSMAPGVISELKDALEIHKASQQHGSDSQGPPKPAVRQRIQQADKVTKPNDQAMKHSDSQQVVASKQDEQTEDYGVSDVNNPRKNSGDPMILRQQQPPETNPQVETNHSKNAFTLPLPTESDHSAPNQQNYSRPYPKKVLFIIANEFCERFSYYGLRTVLVLYFKSVLGLTDSVSTVSFHLFATLCYLTPILGAILGDSILGKFKTILYLSTVYLIGEIILLLSSVFWQEGAISTSATFFGLFLIGLGTGGIKPCVGALGGDQFLEHEEKWRQNFFSLFYGAINLGSLISMFLTPMLRSNYACVNRSDCFPYAFGLPCVLMFVGIVVFLVAKNQYVLNPLPERNVIVAFCRCTYIALKRKICGHDKNPKRRRRLVPSATVGASDETSSSTLSVSSNEGQVVTYRNGAKNYPVDNDQGSQEGKKVFTIDNFSSPLQKPQLEAQASESKTQDHWLYLASDEYDSKSIEDFRSVWNIMLIFAPTPVYWCLFDQQGSLWTLQATRMDGRVFGTGFILQPDQMSVANPLLLLISIAMFQIFIYPCLNRCNVLTKPIPRMTVGGMLAALTFVLSAMIELRIQQFQPMESPPAGKASLLVVNGLSNCYIVTPTISYVQIPGSELAFIGDNQTTDSSITSTTDPALRSGIQFENPLNTLEPLSSSSVNLISANEHLLNNYQLKFRVSSGNGNIMSNQTIFSSSPYPPDSSPTTTTLANCPLDSQKEFEFSLGPLADRSMKLLYLEQGNGKLTYKLLNDSLILPPAGKARVQLLYESFGSYALAERRVFSLVKVSSDSNQNSTATSSTPAAVANSLKQESNQIKLQTKRIDGQLFSSEYVDVPVSSQGDLFVLRTNDGLIGQTNSQSILIEPGTRNLLVVQQSDAMRVEIKHEILQDNQYRISLLYQLGPYLLISISEVMFSITGLEFSYSMAPSTMKSVILGAWGLMNAFGNILTVAVESAHPFSNMAHDFIFYATIMAIDMIVFMIIGFNYKPYKPETTTN